MTKSKVPELQDGSPLDGGSDRPVAEGTIPADLPKTSIQGSSISDQATGTDALGFSPYVKAIAEFLTNQETQPPLTLSIEGGWGSGKSSFMKQLQAEIERIERKNKKPKPKVVWFNAWRHDKVEALWAAFALEFLRQISRPRTCSEIIPTLLGHGKLSLARFNWKEGWLDALKAMALLSIGSSAIILLIVIAAFRGSDWVNHLREVLIQADCSLTHNQSKGTAPQPGSPTSGQNRPTPAASPAPAKTGSGAANQNQPTITDLCADQTSADDHQSQGWHQWVAWLFGVGVGGASILTVVISIVQQLQKLAGNPEKDLMQYLQSPDYKNQVAFIEKFHEDFEKIVTTHAGKGNKVYVFVDDLDRCELTKAAELMQGLNLMIANDPHLIFVLAMDREKVVAGIALKQKDVLPYLPASSIVLDAESEKSGVSSKALEYGHAFLEKFIQLPFKLPEPSQRDFEEFVRATSSKQRQTQSNPSQRNLPQRFYPASQTTSLQPVLELPYGISPNFETASRNWGFLKQLTRQLISWNQNWEPFLSRISRQQTSKPARDEPTPASPTTITPASSNDIKYRRETIRIEVTEDSETVRKIVLMVASALEYNPRRIKQFINLFRLKVFIGSHTGLFDEVINLDEADVAEQPATDPPITLEQLGKFTALCLKYPLLQRDIERDEHLLANLYRQTSQPVDTLLFVDTQPHEKPDALTEYWLKNAQVKELLRKNCDDKKYSLEHVKVKHLLQIAPEVVHRADYSKLHALLEAGQWREADKETFFVMLKVARREEQGYLDVEVFATFPCEDLRLIDRLWVKYSSGKFGFSVQKRIYVECGAKLDGEYPGSEIWKKFGDRVGWRKEDAHLYYSQFTFDLTKSLTGEYPLGWVGGDGWVGGGGRGWGRWGRLFSSLAHRCVNCNI
jgi:hypothetical protein